MPVKVCSRCAILKPLDQFYRRAASRSGIGPHCRDCGLRKAKEYYALNRERIRAKKAVPPPQPIRQPSDTDLAWLAGLLEGEGWFLTCHVTDHKRGRAYSYPRMGVHMTDADVIERAARLIHGPIHRNEPRPPGTKPLYGTAIQGWRAAEWMTLLRPYMGHRRGARIDEVLAAWKERQLACVA